MSVFQIDGYEIVETKRNGIVRYELDDIRIYRVRVESMPGFYTNVYLILDTETTLVDPGSYYESSRTDLLEGLETLNRSYDEGIKLGDIANIILTHGHSDHFAMLAHQDLRGKRVYVHPADDRLMKNYATRDPELVQTVLELVKGAGGSFDTDQHNVWMPPLLPSDIWTSYDFIDIHDGDEILNGYHVYHIPGHSPGHICFTIGPFLFLGDHVLASAPVYQFPGIIMSGLGLETYLASLRKVADIGMTFGLAGHQGSVKAVADRTIEIEAFHHQRLRELIDLCREDTNLYDLTEEYCSRHPEYIGASSLDELEDKTKMVCLEDIMAHMEYLLEHSQMMVSDNGNGVVMYRSKAD